MDSRNGIITGFKLFYWKKGSAGKETKQIVENGTSRSNTLTGLDKYTEYEFELLAFTSVGDGPKSLVKVARTNEDGTCSKLNHSNEVGFQVEKKPRVHFQHEF